jgi:hypothetical protein
MTFVTLYSFIFTGLLFLNCTPFSGVWEQYDLTVLSNPELASQLNCLSADESFLRVTIAGSFSVFTDWYSVMLPAVLLLRVKMNLKQKYGLMLIFGLGYT